MASLRNIGISTEALGARKSFNELSMRVEKLMTGLEETATKRREEWMGRQGYQGSLGAQANPGVLIEEHIGLSPMQNSLLTVLRAFSLALSGDYLILNKLEAEYCQDNDQTRKE